MTAPEATIRPYDPERDADALRACFVELQDRERTLDPRMPRGDDVADAYLELMLERCRTFAGRVLVAERGGAVIGYVTVWARYRSTEPDDDPSEHAFVSDLVVLRAQRGHGVGRRLLTAAEQHAREVGAPCLRLSVKAGNNEAEALYARSGFAPVEIFLEKALR